MKRNLLIFTLAITSMILVVSCSKDDGPNNPQATCSDGIKNGDETGVDCGGSACAPCATNQLAGKLPKTLH